MPRTGSISKTSKIILLSRDTELKEGVAAGLSTSRIGVESADFADAAAVRNMKRAVAVVDCRVGAEGLDAIEKIAGPTKTKPVLAVTGSASDDDCRDAYEKGATACVPIFAGPETIARIAESLDKIRNARDRHRKIVGDLANVKDIIHDLEREREDLRLQLAKKVQEQITVYRAGRVLMGVFDFDALANEIVSLATRELGAEVGSLMVIDGEYLVVRALSGYVPGEDHIMGRRQMVGEGISGWVAREGKPLLITDIDRNPMFRERGSVRYKSKSCISCPIIARGRIRGVINVNNKVGGGHFNDDDLRLLRTLAMTAAVALDNFELLDQMKRAETMSSIGELATRMAHEIRNPLHAIKMTIQILEKKFHMDGENREYYDILIGEIERLEALVKEVLLFVRQDKIEPAKCDVNAILDRILAVFKTSLEDKKITLETSWDRDIPPVIIDERKFEQAIMNLVVNATEAMGSGGRLSMTTKLITPFFFPKSQYGEEITDPIEPDTSILRITVEDTGGGIEKIIAERIFTPFFTTKVHGTGLGLSTTRKIVELHGGSLTFSSVQGEGSTFRVDIPIKE